MKWHVIHTKGGEEFRALENLQNQGFEVFLPTFQVKKKQ
jgi:transcriptional antiterminator RfaH